ncbi:MAG: dienelactone hydrolase family protein [Alphaproteobacteria bacterium]|nr:dienelactone hydrolase family protein [Alphaproteobacteria bacterium]MBL7099302.1 dienelactone hydrolase family protein [Alphaproteobacteria bacterium]
MSDSLLDHVESHSVAVGKRRLPGTLNVPLKASGLVIFAHGSGSSRNSPRNIEVAEALNGLGLATLLFDLLEPAEEVLNNRARVFDIELLASRVVDAVRWSQRQPALNGLPLGLFGASTGAAAALVAASQLKDRVAAVVSRGGRPDLAGKALPNVRAPTLLIVGGHDHSVVQLNERALSEMRCEKALEIIPGATHVFPEPGAMKHVTRLAAQWFIRHLHSSGGQTDAVRQS